MGPSTLLPFPNASIDPIAHDLTEVEAALTLVATGVATRVRLVGLWRPEGLAASALARAQEAGVGFSVDRGANGLVAVTFGPRT
jgi:hypothetical protein